MTVQWTFSWRGWTEVQRRVLRGVSAALMLVLVASGCASSTAGVATGSAASSGETQPAGANAPDVGGNQATTTQEAAAQEAAAEEVAERNAVRESLDEGVRNASQLWSTDWTMTTIDVTELRAGLRGSDTRDGIPPIDNPKYETVESASTWLGDNEPGALVQIDDGAWFFPLSIMTSHEIVNDTLGDVPVAVTFCPLCNTAIAYDRRVDGEVLRFGVSGLLRKSDLVMWDDRTTSLWQQISGLGIVGEHAGVQLEPVSTSIVSFGQFADGFPEGLSLSPDTGFGRGYGNNPYVGYSSGDGPIPQFFVDEVDGRLPALSRVVGVSLGDDIIAYPFDALTAERVINDTVGGQPVAVFWGGSTTDALDGRVIADSAPIGSAVAYLSTVDGMALTFTSAGDAFVDAETGSTWNIVGQATSGPLAGQKLDTAVHKNEFWFAFAGFFPGTKIWAG